MKQRFIFTHTIGNWWLYFEKKITTKLCEWVEGLQLRTGWYLVDRSKYNYLRETGKEAKIDRYFLVYSCMNGLNTRNTGHQTWRKFNTVGNWMTTMMWSRGVAPMSTEFTWTLWSRQELKWPTACAERCFESRARNCTDPNSNSWPLCSLHPSRGSRWCMNPCDSNGKPCACRSGSMCHFSAWCNKR